MRRFLALALVSRCACWPVPGAAEDPVAFIATAPAPATSAVVVWKFQGVESPGVFLAAEQAKLMAAELQICRAAEQSAQRQALPWWLWAASGIALGAVGGYYAFGKVGH